MFKYIYEKKKGNLHYSGGKKKQKSRTELVIKTRSESNYDFSSM